MVTSKDVPWWIGRRKGALRKNHCDRYGERLNGSCSREGESIIENAAL